MPEITEKKCIRCKKSKALNLTNFAKNKRSPDGFCSWCKECQKIYRSRGILDTNHKKKPDSNTPKTYELHDLSCTCKECQKRNEQIYKNQQRRGKADAVKTLGIQNWNQVDSILREMAELQSCINEERALCEKRVSMIRKYSDETIEPLLFHQIALQTMLQNFLRKNERKKLIRSYRFGSINFFRGRLKIQLNVDLAKQRRGKP